jgi:hypothetical protein
MKELKDIAMIASGEIFFYWYSIRKNANASKENKEFFKNWLKREFEESLSFEMKK